MNNPLLGVTPARTILYEGHNLSSGSGTGIATYTRVLADAARSLGYTTDVLVSTRAGVDRKDPLLNEIRFFDAPTKKVTSSQWLRGAANWVFGAPFGVRVAKLPRTGAVVDPSPGNFAGFESIFTVADLFDVGRCHFRRYRGCATLKLDRAPSLFHATHPTPLRVRGCPNIYTIHDLVPLRLPYTTLDNKKYILSLLRHLCERADHIVTVSEFSRRDIIGFSGIAEDRITSTYQSVSIPKHLLDRTDEHVAQDVRNLFGLDYKSYFLFFGAIEPKKNISRLVDGYAASGSRLPLVICGGLGWQFDIDLEKIADERFTSYQVAEGVISPQRRVRRLQYVPFAQLVALVRGARAVLFPSIYEGFGLPVLEAMLLGTPVMTSTAAALPEIAGDAALLVDPTSIEDIAAAIRTLDNDADLREELAARGRKRAELFSLERYQERLRLLYRKFV